MVDSLKAINYVNTFLVCFNSENPKFDEHLKSLMTIFQQIFGYEFFKNIMICFTRYAFDKRSEKKRKKSG